MAIGKLTENKSRTGRLKPIIFFVRNTPNTAPTMAPKMVFLEDSGKVKVCNISDHSAGVYANNLDPVIRKITIDPYKIVSCRRGYFFFLPSIMNNSPAKTMAIK